MAGWHAVNRATPEGKSAERARNKARYPAEAQKRRSGAIAYYYDTQELRIQYARQWRKENPHRRREQADRRAALMIGNPGFRPFGDAEWRKLVNRFGGRCAYCGTRPEALHKDHVVPLSRGGRHAIANILPACQPCNSSKYDLLLSEWRHGRRGR